jgi:hypothetical protein
MHACMCLSHTRHDSHTHMCVCTHKHKQPMQLRVRPMFLPSVAVWLLSDAVLRRLAQEGSREFVSYQDSVLGQLLSGAPRSGIEHARSRLHSAHGVQHMRSHVATPTQRDMPRLGLPPCIAPCPDVLCACAVGCCTAGSLASKRSHHVLPCCLACARGTGPWLLASRCARRQLHHAATGLRAPREL